MKEVKSSNLRLEKKKEEENRSCDLKLFRSILVVSFKNYLLSIKQIRMALSKLNLLLIIIDTTNFWYDVLSCMSLTKVEQCRRRSMFFIVAITEFHMTCQLIQKH